MLDTALKYNLLDSNVLDWIFADRSNVAVTWLFFKGMMVQTEIALTPVRHNAKLNTFFGFLAKEPPEVANTSIENRTDWLTFN